MPPMPADIVKKEGKEHSIPTLAELGYEGVVSHKFPGTYIRSYARQFELNYFFNAYQWLLLFIVSYEKYLIFLHLISFFIIYF